MHIPLLPMRNPNVSLSMHWPVFSPQECASIIAQANAKGWDKRLPIGPGNTKIFPDAKMLPYVERQALPIGKNAYPLDQISYGINQVNSDNWRFELSGIPGDDMPWLVKHSAGRAKKEDWEVDLGPAQTSSRKLCFIVQLSDPKSYSGGDILLHNIPVDQQGFRQQGTLVVFPAYWLHRISDVTKGHRHSIVGWIHGHNFR
ncbi:2OG-Fe(II) oxygenase family protein [Sneathiella sp.]|jgi:PKHD-type hydroxylase|uniref:2OG-Fe(II) oxygenase family protein n=1 Tax=Sneathiella sp. TaxID=1964365 RepID=UPI0039E71CBE